MKRFVFLVLALVLTLLSAILVIIGWDMPAYPEWSYEAAEGENFPAQILGIVTVAVFLGTFSAWNGFSKGLLLCKIKKVFSDYFSRD